MERRFEAQGSFSEEVVWSSRVCDRDSGVDNVTRYPGLTSTNDLIYVGSGLRRGTHHTC
jgi:hypothetical protein